jgi:AraC family transcriptional regulator of adaptative response/methylated-DNA-[protein]-cysteine methyltransferase
MMINEAEAWQAFEARDPSHDERFVVAVTTTRIYCRPSCPARRPRREHVRFYDKGEAAVAAGYRSCKRCKPDEAARDKQAVARALDILASRRRSLSGWKRWPRAVGYALHHFQRLFVREVGVSPAAWQRARRLGDADRSWPRVPASPKPSMLLATARRAASTKMRGRLGMTPAAARKGGQGMVINWARVASRFGPLLIAATERGLCRVSFEEDVDALQRRYPAAELVENVEAPLIKAAVAAIDDPALAASLPTDVSGTAFQQRVWAELRRIPPGETRSYLDIARAIGDPTRPGR